MHKMLKQKGKEIKTKANAEGLGLGEENDKCHSQVSSEGPHTASEVYFQASGALCQVLGLTLRMSRGSRQKGESPFVDNLGFSQLFRSRVARPT